MNDQTPQSEDPWETCEAGIISDSAQSFPSSIPMARRSFIIRCFGFAGAAALVVGVTRLTMNNEDDVKRSAVPTGLACSQVHANLAAFVNNKITDKKLRKQMSCHLYRCCSCRQSYKKVRKENGFTCNSAFDPKPDCSQEETPCSRANSSNDSDESRCRSKEVAKDCGCPPAHLDNKTLP